MIKYNTLNYYRQSYNYYINNLGFKYFWISFSTGLSPRKQEIKVYKATGEYLILFEELHC